MNRRSSRRRERRTSPRRARLPTTTVMLPLLRSSLRPRSALTERAQVQQRFQGAELADGQADAAMPGSSLAVTDSAARISLM